MFEILDNGNMEAVPVFLCEVRFVKNGEAAIDINISDALEPYEALGEDFEAAIENISDVLVGDTILLCSGLTLIYDEEELEGETFAVEHLLLEDNTCFVNFDEEFYERFSARSDEQQKIKLEFLMELFMQTSSSTHDMIIDILQNLTECAEAEGGIRSLQ